jgi:hypothetical protein
MPCERNGDASPATASSPARDTETTAFTAILEALLTSTKASGAALVDPFGETVDYAGIQDPFEIRIAAAHWQILVAAAQCAAALGPTRWIVLRGRKHGIVGHRLPEGYALIVLLRARSTFRLSRRALDSTIRAICREAAWSFEEEHSSVHPLWSTLSVETDEKGRPFRIPETPSPLEVIGTLNGLSTGERGYRVRTLEGAERTVIREVSGLWYVDAPF